MEPGATVFAVPISPNNISLLVQTLVLAPSFCPCKSCMGNCNVSSVAVRSMLSCTLLEQYCLGSAGQY